MATCSQAPLPFSGSGEPWEARAKWGFSTAAASATPSHFVQPAGAFGQYGSSATAGPAFGASVFHTTESLALESPPSADVYPHYYSSWGQLQAGTSAQSSHQTGSAAHPQPMPAEYMQQLEQQNAELARQCRELQERLEAGAAAVSPPTMARDDVEASPLLPPGSARRRSSPQQPGQHGVTLPSPLSGEPDREDMELLQRRLAAKQREAEAAAAAAAAKQAQAAAKEAELAQERGRAAELADQVAQWKDECAQVGAPPEACTGSLPSALPPDLHVLPPEGTHLLAAPPLPCRALQRERELRALQQRLEVAASHAGLLEDGGAALRKKNAELGTALAQRDVTIRQLEDRLRSLQVGVGGWIGVPWRRMLAGKQRGLLAAPASCCCFDGSPRELVQGSDGSKERQLGALYGEGEALRRENSALRQQAAGLEVSAAGSGTTASPSRRRSVCSCMHGACSAPRATVA